MNVWNNKMKIFWFERDPEQYILQNRIKELTDTGFTGMMLPFAAGEFDYFTKIANSLDTNSKFEYIVAIRPYTISPQYLSMIMNSINIFIKDKLYINFVTGWIYEGEKNVGGILSTINDNSSNIERSNFMLEYSKVFNNFNNNFFISTTNNNILSFCKNENFKMIVPYSRFNEYKNDLKNEKYLISIMPIIRDVPENIDYAGGDAQLFTEDEFINFLLKCKNNNVYGVLIHEFSNSKEYEKIKKCIKKYLSISTN